MHISDVEKARMAKEHKMRHGYQDHSNKKFPHNNGGDDVTEAQYMPKDMDNKHAKEITAADMVMEQSK